jgi:hypothetical protein
MIKAWYSGIRYILKAIKKIFLKKFSNLIAYGFYLYYLIVKKQYWDSIF